MTLLCIAFVPNVRFVLLSNHFPLRKMVRWLERIGILYQNQFRLINAFKK